MANEIAYHPEVRAARDAGRPVVALESTVITHGLPFPENLDVAQAMESALRTGGVTPATLAVVAGVIRIGLTEVELSALAQAGPHKLRKCSLRDLPLALAGGEHGGTTVAATAYLAHRAGIQVFATGGIGGVHRDAPEDVSADLPALANTPITVVCAGAKAILDLPRTRERLETDGVTLIGYRCDELPAFYSRSSGLPVDQRCDRPEEVAAIIRARDTLKLPTAILVGVPVPEADEWPADEAEACIRRALADASQRGIRGHALTPFLLEQVSQLSGDASRRANIALLKNNAAVAAEIATALGPESRL